MRIYAVTTVMVFVLALGSHSQGQNTTAKDGTKMSKASAQSCEEFRYVIIAETSAIQRFVNKGPESRDIVVLMQEDAFNEENLKKLFFMLSERYKDRPRLYARVFTTLAAIPTPEEYDRMNLYGPLENFRQFKNAYFSRDDRGNIIRYEIPGRVDLKQIFLGHGQNK